MFERARKKYKDEESKIIVGKMIDKYEFCKTKNKITYTDFLTISELSILKSILKEEYIENYKIYGVKNEADRNIIIFYPEKFSVEMLEKNLVKILKIIRITLPKDIHYEHREYLSGIMKLGIKREKFGDIVVTDNGADVVIFSDIADIFLNDLQLLTRFRRAQIEIKEITDLINKENEFEDIKIIVSSIRLDNFVAELANCSRTMASEIIMQGKVFINSINELKDSKKINVNDIITIRGKGKFIYLGIEKETKSGRYLVQMKKYK